MPELINEPDASRLIFGLRDTGYSFETAAADIIDNSIAANADEVHVRIDITADGRKFVYFGDNGDGMDGNGLYEAMRYGAPSRENLASLGKFGLGLKTASSSVCRNFALISKDDESAQLSRLAWDLDHVNATGKWEMRNDPPDDHELEVFEELCGSHGTLVVWSNCDRILPKDYDEPGGLKEQQAIKRLRKRLVDHIALIYHRFLDNQDKRQRTVRMTVNGEQVVAWNPFFPEKSEQVLPESQQQLFIDSTDGEAIGSAKIRAWILPHSNDLDDVDKKKARITNRGQGFYIFREGRLINIGGWLGLFTQEPHFSMLRIEFDFDHELDEAFRVDVKKSRILFDPAIDEHLQGLLKNARREANNRYRRRSRDAVTGTKLSHSSANKSIDTTPTAKKPVVQRVENDTQTAIVSNSRGAGIRVRQPIHNNVSHDKIHVDAVDSITTGNLWEPVFRSQGTSGHVPGVALNIHHDFYQKVYQRAGTNWYSVQGMDLLLWALAVAETDYSDEEMAKIFDDIRDEVSSNLRKLLRDVPVPDKEDLTGEAED